jgi:serine/threonine protein kinase
MCCRKVAVKTLSPRYAGNPKLRERFMREARALARLDHPNIVRIYNLGDADEEPHFVMERIEGASLTEAARRRGVPAGLLSVAAHFADHRYERLGNLLIVHERA